MRIVMSVLGRIMSGLTCVADQLPVPRAVGGTGAKIVWTYFLRLRANCLLKWSRVGNCGRAGHGKSSGKAIA